MDTVVDIFQTIAIICLIIFTNSQERKIKNLEKKLGE